MNTEFQLNLAIQCLICLFLRMKKRFNNLKKRLPKRIPTIRYRKVTGGLISFLRNKRFLLIVQILIITGFVSYAVYSAVKYKSQTAVTVDSKYDKVTTPGSDTKEIKKSDRYEAAIKSNSFDIFYYIEDLFRGWNKLFDLFASNPAYKQEIKSINQDKLETITERIRKAPYIGSLGALQGLVDIYGDVIIRECNYYKLDWRLVLAIIRQESYFNENALSHAGAYGFMQLMPRTGAGLQSQLELQDTKMPQNNLIAGIYYYASLVSQFSDLGEDKYKFALASYNAGLGRVVDAMTITAHLGKDYHTWDNVKESYPLLASKNDSLHATIWPDRKKPTYGTLDNWKEPYNYVDNIWFYYQAYKKLIEGNLPEEKVVKKKTKNKSKSKN